MGVKCISVEVTQLHKEMHCLFSLICLIWTVNMCVIERERVRERRHTYAIIVCKYRLYRG